MSFLTTQPEALAFAAGKLEGIGAGMAAQNAAAAAPTTGVVPAAADEVSALQATQFAAYGSLYQQVSAQAMAIHEMFVNTLGTSATSYGDTEAANSAAAGSQSGLSGILGALPGSGASSSGSSGLSGILSGLFGSSGLSSNAGSGAITQIGNFGSAASDLTQLGSAGFVTQGPQDLPAEALGAGLGGVGGPVLAGAVGPAGPAGLGVAPVLAGVGQASSIGGLSVPPSWVGTAATVSGPAPATLAGAGWTTPAPQSTPVTTMPAGMPAVASAGRGGFGFGAPRYGVKPTVMPRPAVV